MCFWDLYLSIKGNTQSKNTNSTCNNFKDFNWPPVNVLLYLRNILIYSWKFNKPSSPSHPPANKAVFPCIPSPEVLVTRAIALLSKAQSILCVSPPTANEERLHSKSIYIMHGFLSVACLMERSLTSHNSITPIHQFWDWMDGWMNGGRKNVGKPHRVRRFTYQSDRTRKKCLVITNDMLMWRHWVSSLGWREEQAENPQDVFRGLRWLIESMFSKKICFFPPRFTSRTDWDTECDKTAPIKIASILTILRGIIKRCLTKHPTN